MKEGFPGYTKIHTPVGHISIGNLRTGDIILGFDVDNKVIIHQKVHDIRFNGIHDTYYTKFEDNIVIPSTLLVSVLDLKFDKCLIKEANECISIKDNSIKRHLFNGSAHGLRQLVYFPEVDHPIIIEGVVVGN